MKNLVDEYNNQDWKTKQVNGQAGENAKILFPFLQTKQFKDRFSEILSESRKKSQIKKKANVVVSKTKGGSHQRQYEDDEDDDNDHEDSYDAQQKGESGQQANGAVDCTKESTESNQTRPCTLALSKENSVRAVSLSAVELADSTSPMSTTLTPAVSTTTESTSAALIHSNNSTILTTPPAMLKAISMVSAQAKEAKIITPTPHLKINHVEHTIEPIFPLSPGATIFTSITAEGLNELYNHATTNSPVESTSKTTEAYHHTSTPVLSVQSIVNTTVDSNSTSVLSTKPSNTARAGEVTPISALFPLVTNTTSSVVPSIVVHSDTVKNTSTVSPATTIMPSAPLYAKKLEKTLSRYLNTFYIDPPKPKRNSTVTNVTGTRNTYEVKIDPRNRYFYTNSINSPPRTIPTPDELIIFATLLIFSMLLILYCCWLFSLKICKELYLNFENIIDNLCPRNRPVHSFSVRYNNNNAVHLRHVISSIEGATQNMRLETLEQDRARSSVQQSAFDWKQFDSSNSFTENGTSSTGVKFEATQEEQEKEVLDSDTSFVNPCFVDGNGEANQDDAADAITNIADNSMVDVADDLKTVVLVSSRKIEPSSRKLVLPEQTTTAASKYTEMSTKDGKADAEEGQKSTEKHGMVNKKGKAEPKTSPKSTSLTSSLWLFESSSNNSEYF